MTGIRNCYLVCDQCGVADREGGANPVTSIKDARRTTSFVRRGRLDLCRDCAGLDEEMVR